MKHRQIVGLIVIVFGLSFLFEFPFFNILFSLVIIYLGVQVLTGKTIGFPFISNEDVVSSENEIKRVLIFSSLKLSSKSKDFTGAEIVTVFGGAKIDLSNTSAASDQVKINLVCILGTIDLSVPKSWEITTEGVGILGTFSNSSAKPAKKNTDVKIEGVSILGTIQISN